jgi:hypothetical protein
MFLGAAAGIGALVEFLGAGAGGAAAVGFAEGLGGLAAEGAAVTATGELGAGAALGAESAVAAAETAETAEAIEQSGVAVRAAASAGRALKTGVDALSTVGGVASGAAATALAVKQGVKYGEKGERVKRLLGPSMGHYTKDWAHHLADINKYAVMNAAAEIRNQGGSNTKEGTLTAEDYVTQYLNDGNKNGDWQMLKQFSEENITIFYSKKDKQLVGVFSGNYAPIDFVHDAINNRSNGRDRDDLQHSLDLWSDIKGKIASTGDFPVDNYYATGKREGGKVATYVTHGDSSVHGVVFNPLRMPQGILDTSADVVTKYLGYEQNKQWMNRMTIARVDGDRYSYGVLDDIESTDPNYNDRRRFRPVGQGLSTEQKPGYGMLINVPASDPYSHLIVKRNTKLSGNDKILDRVFQGDYQRSATSLDNFLTVNQSLDYNNSAGISQNDRSAYLANGILDGTADLLKNHKPNEAHKGILTSVLREATYQAIKDRTEDSSSIVSSAIKQMIEDNQKAMAVATDSGAAMQEVLDSEHKSTRETDVTEDHLSSAPASSENVIKKATQMDKQPVEPQVETGDKTTLAEQFANQVLPVQKPTKYNSKSKSKKSRDVKLSENPRRTKKAAIHQDEKTEQPEPTPTPAPAEPAKPDPTPKPEPKKEDDLFVFVRR